MFNSSRFHYLRTHMNLFRRQSLRILLLLILCMGCQLFLPGSGGRRSKHKIVPRLGLGLSFAQAPNADRNSGDNYVPEKASRIGRRSVERWVIYDRSDQTDWLRLSLPDDETRWALIRLDFKRVEGRVRLELYKGDPYGEILEQQVLTEAGDFHYVSEPGTEYYLKIYAEGRGSLAQYTFMYDLRSVPTPTATPTSTPTPIPTATATPTPSPTATPTATATPIPTATATPTLTPTFTPSPIPTITPTATPSPAPTATATPTVTPTFTPSPIPTETATPTATPSSVPTATTTFTVTATPTAILSAAPSPLPMATATPTAIPTAVPTATLSPVPTEMTMPPTATATETVETESSPTPSPLPEESAGQHSGGAETSSGETSQKAESRLEKIMSSFGGGVNLGLLIAVGICLLVILLLLILLLLTKKRLAKAGRSVVDTLRSADYKVLGDLAAEQGKTHIAERCYRKMIDSEPYNRNIRYELGLFLFQVERYREAIKEFSIYLGSEIVDSEVYAYLAYAYLATENLSKAEEFYKKALEVKPEDPHVYFGLGVIAQSRGHYPQAEEYYQNVLDLDPGFEDVRQNLRQIQPYL